MTEEHAYEPAPFIESVGKNHLVYPLDQSPENFYPECISFTFQKRLGIGLKEAVDIIGESMASRFGSGYDNYANEIDDYKQTKAAINPDLPEEQIKLFEGILLDEWKKNHNDQEPDLNNLQRVMSGMKESGKKTGAFNQKALEAKKESKHILGTVYLNMPQTIQFDNSASWAGKSLGAIGNVVKNTITGGGSLGSAASAGKGAVVGGAGAIGGAGIGGTIGFLADKLGLPAGTGVGALAGAFAGGGGIQDGLEAALSVAQNPYEEMMFSGITFREFSFDFLFRPRNGKEIEEVEKIIRMFRTHTRPSYVGSTMGKSFMNNPQEFQIKFLTMGQGFRDYKINKYLPKIKTCVCDKVTTNYTPQSVWTSYENGVPIAITMSLGFKEKELVMAEDIEWEWDNTPGKGGY
jgi:hypothetical protein